MAALLQLGSHATAAKDPDAKEKKPNLFKPRLLNEIPNASIDRGMETKKATET